MVTGSIAAIAEIGGFGDFTNPYRRRELRWFELMAVEHLLQPVVDTALNGYWFAYSVSDQG